MPQPIVPRFFLYGEPPRTPEDRFVHLEEIDDRARPASWRIEAHAHADLHQVFAIRAGGGTIAVESEALAFGAPAVLVVPAGTVHGFRFEAGTAGKVLTISDALLRETVRADGAFAPIFEEVRRLDPGGNAALAKQLDALALELGEGDIARRGALVAHVTLAFVSLARLLARESEPPSPQEARSPQPGQHALIVARFRAAVEERFHTQAGLDTYCRALGITEGRLRLACRTVADTTPARLVAERVIREAKRALAFSDHPVAEVAFGLGFPDPAYFARYFTRETGQSPTAFRRASRGV